MYALLRPLLFLLDPERAHGLALALLHLGLRVPLLRRLLRAPPPSPSLAVETLGCRFASPVGLAAGFDKNATHADDLLTLGFAAVEAGTVTAHPQPGNDRPRLFRLPADRALVNRMGFNNDGCDVVARRLTPRRPRRGVLGINIGKSKRTPFAEAAADYRTSARALAPLADYLVVNVSSPNTPGLRDLQAVAQLRPILQAVAEELRALPEPPALLVKVAPDLADADVDAIADLALELGLAGIVATNTTIARPALHTPARAVERLGPGGLSGPPLKPRALAVLRRLHRRVGGRLVLVAAGGIETVDDVWERLAAGASLVQIYTGFIYGGPRLPARLNRGLAHRLRAAGLATVAQLIGSEAQSADIRTASTVPPA